MECENCDCREADFYCSSGCNCHDGGAHLCFDEDNKYLGCWSHAETVRELVWMARQVARSMPKGSQVRPVDFSGGKRLGGWHFEVPVEPESRERVAGGFLGEDGTLNLLWTQGTEPGTREAGLRWQVLEEGSDLPAAGAGESLTPRVISRALVDLLG
jgi:hypothetical protein